MTKAWPSLVAAVAVLTALPAGAAPIPVTVEQAMRIGLRAAPVQAAGATPLATLPAVVTPSPQGRVAVTAPFGGVVRQSLVIEGQAVTKGQRLAVVYSREVVSLNADLARARARLSVARQSSQRTQMLAREGVIAGARAEEAAASLREAEVDVAEKSRLLGMAGGHAADGLYTLVAPISGTVTQSHAAVGSALDASAAPFVIDAPGPAQVEAQVPARLVGVLKAGMRARVGAAEGRVLAVGSTVDPQTRSARLRASVGNGSGLVAGGAISLVVMADAAAGAVTAPSTALVRLGDQQVVFQQTPQGYVARPIRLLGSAGGVSTFTGVAPGTRVAVAGVSALKSLAAE